MAPTKVEGEQSFPSDHSSPSQRSKQNLKKSVLTRPSIMNVARALSNPSKMALNRSPSNFFFDAVVRFHSRTPSAKVDSRTGCYEKLKVTSSNQYYREDWGGVTAIRYLHDGERTAVGFNSGDLQICNPSMSPMRSGPCETILKGWEGNDSISCIRFHPKKPSVMFISNTAGTVTRRDLDDNTNYNDSFISEADNEIYSMDFTSNSELITAGRDATVRLYDVVEDKLVRVFGRRRLSTYSSDTAGTLDSYSDESFHAKRIYCVRCHPSDPFVLVTGGWDGVKVWDSRAENPVRSIVGPFIFGDSVDICKGLVLTASCEAGSRLQLWDMGSGFLINDVNPTNRRVYLYGEYPYVAQFFRGDPTGDLVLFGVGGLQLISVNESLILYLFEDEKPVAAVDSTDKRLAFGGKSNSVLYGKVLLLPESDAISGTSSSQTLSLMSDDQSSVNASKKYGSDSQV